MEKSVLLTFHHYLFCLLGFTKIIKPVVLVSKSKDGDILSSFLEAADVRTIRGSSSRGGAEALREILNETSDSILIAVDGPRGPAFDVKPGAEFISEKSGRKMIGIFISVSSFWRLNSWDRTIIPKPFAKLDLRLFEIKNSISEELKAYEPGL